MRRLAVLLVLASLISCKGEKGEQGQAGAPGVSIISPESDSAPEILEFKGTVGTGVAFIGTPLKENSVVLVYLESTGNNGIFVLLSIDSQNAGPWCEVSYPLQAVSFHNCQPTSRYKILVINPS